MSLSAAAVAGFLVIFSANHWSAFIWIIVSPGLYLSWLIVFLAISAWTSGRIARGNPKPRHMVVKGNERISKEALGLMTATFCYRRLALINSLPLVPTFREAGPFQKLVLRAYSPSVHVGQQSLTAGQLFDPDLTEVGNYAIIGAHSVISAHATSRRPDGGLVYLTAPIKIGDRATIGGGAIVCAGCVVEEDAIIEIGSVVPQFTKVPRGEVWGGNPARFLRKRDELIEGTQTETESNQTPTIEPVSEEIRALVIEALMLKPEEAPDPLDMDNCEFWDSMGQMAIAALISDRYRVSVPAEQVTRIRNLQDVADLLVGRELSPKPSKASAASGSPA
jgi:carbonic anhydrase/acetyltransferase-like protein (isoleucine patch superfamily)/acyl carrier protein